VSSYAGKIINIRHLDQVIKSINGWYYERGLSGLVSSALTCFCSYFAVIFSLVSSLLKPCFRDIINLLLVLFFWDCCLRFHMLRFFLEESLGYKSPKLRSTIPSFSFLIEGRENNILLLHLESQTAY